MRLNGGVVICEHYTCCIVVFEWEKSRTVFPHDFPFRIGKVFFAPFSKSFRSPISFAIDSIVENDAVHRRRTLFIIHQYMCFLLHFNWCSVRDTLHCTRRCFLSVERERAPAKKYIEIKSTTDDCLFNLSIDNEQFPRAFKNGRMSGSHQNTLRILMRLSQLLELCAGGYFSLLITFRCVAYIVHKAHKYSYWGIKYEERNT